MLNSVVAQLEPRTFIIINVLDVETGNFVGEPVTIDVIQEFQGVILDRYSMNVFGPDQIKYIPWNPNFLEVGTKIQLIANKDGFSSSESYSFMITSETPVEGLLFEHTFSLRRETLEEPQIINVETRTVELNNVLHNIEITTSSELLDFSFGESSRVLNVRVQETGTNGFLNVSIPVTFMEGPFTVIIDETLIHSFSFGKKDSDATIGVTYPAGLHDISITAKIINQSEGFVGELLLNIPSNTIQIGERLEVSGRMEPPQAQTDVSLTYTSPEGLVTQRLVATLADGTFSDRFTPDEAGSWMVVAVVLMAGDGNGGRTELPFTVLGSIGGEEPAGGEVEELENGEVDEETEDGEIGTILPTLLIGVIAVLVVAGVSMLLLRKRRQTK